MGMERMPNLYQERQNGTNEWHNIKNETASSE